MAILKEIAREFGRSKAFWDLGLSLSGTHAVTGAFRPIFKALDIEYKLDEILKDGDEKIIREFEETLEKLE